MNHRRQQDFLCFYKGFKYEVHFVLMLNKTSLKGGCSHAEPGGIQMGPRAGKWHTLLSTSLGELYSLGSAPEAADMGSPTVTFAKARNETRAFASCTCIRCAEPGAGRLMSFYMWLENRLKLPLKFLGTKGCYSSVQPGLLYELCAERAEIREGWNTQLLKYECVCRCRKTGHLVLNIFPSLPASIVKYLSLVPLHQKSQRAD